MIRKGVIFFALLAVLSSVLFIDYQTYSRVSIASQTAAATTGNVSEAPKVSTTASCDPKPEDKANAQCPDSKPPAEYYSTSAPYYPNGIPLPGGTKTTNYYGKECGETLPNNDTLIGTCACPKVCRVKTIKKANGEEQKFTGGATAALQSGTVSDVSGTGNVLAAPVDNPPKIPAAQAPARPEIGNAYNPSNATPAAAPAAPAPQIPAQPSGGSIPAGSVVQPAQPSFPSGQPAVLTPSGQYPQTPPQPGYTPTPQYPQYSGSQTTFGNTYSSSGYQSSSNRPGNGFISSIASLVGGLFSIPANTVVTYIQSFVSPTQSAPAASPASPQRQNPTQVFVVLPYQVPAATNPDIYGQIRAFANQGNELPVPTISSIASTPRGTTAAPVPASDGVSEQSGAASSNLGGVKTEVRTNGQVSQTTQTRAEIEAAFMKEAATTTESTSTPAQEWHEPDVVEVGVPVDITDPASYESILAYINGDWTHVQRTILQNKTALAQAESERESIIAHIGALREARDAGICDEICADFLSALQKDLPEIDSHIETLQRAIQNETTPQVHYPPPTVGQISRVAESLAEPVYAPSTPTSPRSPSTPPATVSVSSQETAPVSGEVKGEATVLRIVRSVWDFLKSLFLPSSEAQAPKATCSLFRSLFGGCK